MDSLPVQFPHRLLTFIPALSVVGLLIYVLYQRYFHPLAQYPGPFFASLTDLWQVNQFLTLKQPYHLTALHEKYGPVVRYGPDKISVTSEDAIPLLYQKGGKMYPKTEFYDAYGSTHPNVFGMRDELKHSIRRRHMSHSFSMAYIKNLEEYMDLNMAILVRKIRQCAANQEILDLKRVLHMYVVDVLGELAFSQSFGVQLADDEAMAPPVKEHSLLSAATGAWPAMTSRLKRWLPLVPIESLQRLFAGRAACANLAAKCVARRLQEVEKGEEGHRKDILTNLILARHPDSGEKLSQLDLETEAFGFMYGVLFAIQKQKFFY